MDANTKSMHNRVIKQKLFDLLKKAIKLIGEFKC